VGEPVDLFELVDPTIRAEFVEQSTPPHGLELAWVADEHDPPLVALGERDQPMQVGGGDHAGFVHHHRRVRG
jgi:hypothetical protein